MDFTKGEDSKQKEESEKKNDKNLGIEEQSDSSSMIESIEMGSGCVADMNKSTNSTLAQQELVLDDIINSKMLDKAKELFDIKKITVKGKN